MPATMEEASSASAGVDVQPNVNLTLSRASSGVRPIASSTWETVAAPDWHADPAEAALGRFHLLVNNAGILRPGSTWEQPIDDWDAVFGVNVFGVAHGVQAFVPRMLAGGEEGIVINTSSRNGPISLVPDAVVYAASKSAVTTMTSASRSQPQLSSASGMSSRGPRKASDPPWYISGSCQKLSGISAPRACRTRATWFT